MLNGVYKSLLLIGLFAVLSSLKVIATGGDYVQEILYTIPWGDDECNLTSSWNYNPGQVISEEEVIIPPPKWEISSNDELIIIEQRIQELFIKKFDSSGFLVASNDLRSNDLLVRDMCISTSDYLLYWGIFKNNIILFDPSLNIIAESDLTSVFPNLQQINDISYSDSGGFWILGKGHYSGGNYYIILIEYRIDSTFSEPITIWIGTFEDPIQWNYNYVSPEGEVTKYFEDQYGYTYRNYGIYIEKIDSSGTIIFNNGYTSAI